jgi:Tfp pilus assembly protein PilN
MININLLPGAKKSSASSKFDFSALGSLRDQVKDPWMLGASAMVIVSVAAVGVLFTGQQASAAELTERLDRAQRDSTRYSSVLGARRKIIAERDSVERQLGAIRLIDDARYQWPHILDEVSRALPAYTWLTVIEQTSKAPLPPVADSTAKPAKEEALTTRQKEVALAKAKADSIERAQPSELRFRIVGQTVDIQALTLYIRQLESSPFIQNVSLVRSEIVINDGKDITEFEINATFESPAPGVIRTTALVVPVR